MELHHARPGMMTMRNLALTTLALLAATPAFAQRVDTRRIDIEQIDGTVSCRFNAYRDLRLVHESDGSRAGATWERESVEHAGRRPARLSMMFERATTTWETPPIPILLLAVPEEDASGSPRPELRAVLDNGAPIPLDTSWTVDVDRVLYSIQLDREAFGHQLIQAHWLRLELVDARGTVVQRFHWDTSRLLDAVEVVSIVGWRCIRPPEGSSGLR